MAVDAVLRLGDGRGLGYCEHGEPRGSPVFFFHGFPGSRIEWPDFDAEDHAAQLGIRIIAVDRPGYGLSDHLRGRTILDWPRDLCELADGLGIERFAVLGVSGGGVYAAACAHELPERLTAVGIVSGMGPPGTPEAEDGLSWTFVRQGAIARWLTLRLTAMVVRWQPERFVAQMIEGLSASDRLLLTDRPELADMFRRDWEEAFRSGIAGAYHEAALLGRPWGFALEDIRAKVHLWHGGDDANVRTAVGRDVALAIPGCSAEILEEEGHVSLVVVHLPAILSALVS